MAFAALYQLLSLWLLKVYFKLKIAITTDPGLPVPPKLYGGIERVINSLVTGLVQLNHEVTLFAHQDSEVACKLISYPGKGQSAKSFISNCYTISKNILKNKYDLVHSFGRLAYLAPLLPLSIPKLMSYQREPTISQIKKAVLLAKKNTLYFSGCSNYITQQIEPFAPACTIYNSVTTEKYQANTNFKPDAPLIFLGRIEPIKGTHTAIEIALKTNKKLIIAGNIAPEHQAYFDHEIEPYLNHQITYTGPVNDQQKNQLLQNASALLMPIQWNEPFGIVMIEAMACGTPVIALKRGAVPEIIKNGENGFYGDTTEDMIAAVQKIYLLDRSRVRTMAKERFSETIITHDYLNYYRNILQKSIE
ncbi:MAG: glycosyltransferase family 4 protein [Sphingobacteriaceae bacterium]|nr:MAG: glycosyltransferase family 4 protein [Sphingobacteriaceae bacterium]